ncbi:hypothetical protein AB0P15_33935 [Streptomyces sp. NPDC087917]|uniref:terpene synthase family protein n=1 Tax=Streptomyces sp. NPDC087917 TaxID=3155060 RepID=UPI00342C080C
MTTVHDHDNQGLDPEHGQRPDPGQDHNPYRDPDRGERLAPLVAVADSALLGARTIQLLRRLDAWTASLDTPVRPQVAEMAALALASAAPESTAGELLTAAMSVVWAQVTDDGFDVNARTIDDVEDLIEGCRQAARGGAPRPGQPGEQMLSSLAAHLRSTDPEPELEQLWLRRLDRMLEGCRFEWTTAHAHAAGGAPTTLPEYLAHHHSVGFTTICAAWWTSGGQILLPHLDRLSDAADHFETAIRLANDQRTSHREQLEGSAINAALLGADAAWIHHQIRAHLDAGHTLITELAATLPQARHLGRVANWLVGLYQITEPRLAS